MKAAIYTGFDRTLPFPQALQMIHGAGFEVVAIGADPHQLDYTSAEGRAFIREQLDRFGMTIDSVHAPFPEGDRLFSLDEAERQESVRLCRIALDAAAELDGRIVVIHLIQPYGIPPGDTRDGMVEQGRRSVAGLVEHAAKQGVRLALENGQMRDYDEVLIRFLTEFSAEHVGFCYDSGHENVQGCCFRLLQQFSDRLFTVHIHDNQGADTHTLPWEGTIDWNRFRHVFHGLDYAGNLLLEVVTSQSRFKDHTAFLAEARKRADRLLRAPGGCKVTEEDSG